jgi:hypothetical protein
MQNLTLIELVMYPQSEIKVQSTNKFRNTIVLKSLELFQWGGPRDVGDGCGREQLRVDAARNTLRMRPPSRHLCAVARSFKTCPSRRPRPTPSATVAPTWSSPSTTGFVPGSQPPTLALARSPLPSDARRGAASHESEHENGGQQVGA